MDSDFLLKSIRNAKLDADLEVSFKSKINNGIKIEGNQFNSSWRKESAVVGVRCLYKGRIGIATSSINGGNDIKGLIETSYKLAKLAGATDCQSCFTDKIIKIGINRMKIEKASNDESPVNALNAANKITSKIKKVHSINAVLDYSNENLAIANSNGVAGDENGTISGLITEVTSKDGNESASGIKAQEALDFHDLDIDTNFRKAAEMAISMLGSKPAPTFNGTVLLSPEAANGLIAAFVEAMSGEEILKRRSFLSDKKGKIVASTALKLTENPFVSGSPHNRSFDDELVKTSTKDLVSDGVLRTYLHNVYSAEKMGEKPTGNAFRSREGFVDTTNVLVGTGKESPEQLIGRIEEGIYLLDTEDSPNMTTGDLSALVISGYYVKDGRIMHPVKETMIGINMIDLMQNVVAVGNDPLSLNGVASPSLLIKDVKISGR